MNPPFDYDWTQAEALFGRPDQPVSPAMASLVVEMRDAVLLGLDGLIQGVQSSNADPTVLGDQIHQLKGNLMNFGFLAASSQLQKGWSHRDQPQLCVDELKLVRDGFLSTLNVLGQRYTAIGDALKVKASLS